MLQAQGGEKRCVGLLVLVLNGSSKHIRAVKVRDEACTILSFSDLVSALSKCVFLWDDRVCIKDEILRTQDP